MFFYIILAALLVEYILDLAGNLLNLKALKLKPPAGLEGIYPEAEYRKSQEYTRANTRFSLVSSTFGLVVLLVFWFSGGFNFLDQLIRPLGFGPVVNGLLFIGILGVGYTLINLPFSIYHTFVIQERFGFNRVTPRTFVMDRAKGFVLALLIGAPLLAGILALFEYGGSLAWLYCWIAFSIFTLMVQYVAPTWIMPLFNKFTPLEPGELRDAIFSYAGSVNFPLQNVFVMDGSKRSAKSNAFFTGIGRNKRIALFDTLVAKHTVPELVAVLAHEIGHYKKKHILQRTLLGLVQSGLMFFLLGVFLSSAGLQEAFFMDNVSVYAGLIFFGLLFTPLEMVISAGSQVLSRKHEYEADRFAAETTRQPEAMKDALKNLAAANLSNLTPHPCFVFMNYSHPPVAERIKAIEDVGV